MKVERLGHINIRTPLFEETLAFYERVLGLRRGEAASMRDQSGNAWLYDEAGAPLIHVNSPLPGEAVRPAGADGRLDHVAFDCSDADGFRARLDALGLAYRAAPTAAGGLFQINLHDPNGIKLELTFRE